MEAICNNCRHRGTVPNSVHSSCHHPIAIEIIGSHTDLYDMIKFVMVENGRLGYTGSLELKLKGEYEEYAISNGYFIFPSYFIFFIFPINFDPGWIENCNGFEEAK